MMMMMVEREREGNTCWCCILSISLLLLPSFAFLDPLRNFAFSCPFLFLLSSVHPHESLLRDLFLSSISISAVIPSLFMHVMGFLFVSLLLVSKFYVFFFYEKKMRFTFASFANLSLSPFTINFTFEVKHQVFMVAF